MFADGMKGCGWTMAPLRRAIHFLPLTLGPQRTEQAGASRFATSRGRRLLFVVPARGQVGRSRFTASRHSEFRQGMGHPRRTCESLTRRLGSSAGVAGHGTFQKAGRFAQVRMIRRTRRTDDLPPGKVAVPKCTPGWPRGRREIHPFAETPVEIGRCGAG